MISGIHISGNCDKLVENIPLVENWFPYSRENKILISGMACDFGHPVMGYISPFHVSLFKAV